MVLRRSLLLLIALLLPTIAFATTTYVVKKGDNLYDLSREYGVSVEDIKTLNKLSNIDLGIGDELLIPSSNKDGNNKYVVKSGDTVSQIAEKFGVKTKELKTANKLRNDSLRIGQTLYIPSNNNLTNEVVSKDTAASKNVEVSTPIKRETPLPSAYTVKKGDTLGEIAEAYGVKTSQLKEANNLKSHNLQIGQKLVIPNSKVATAKSTNINSQKKSDSSITVSNTYKVSKGDTISDISNKFEISKEKIKKWNNLDNNNLKIGQNLFLTPNKNIISASQRAQMKVKSKFTGEYKVKSGDTLGHIAAKHKVSVSDLKAANDLTNNNLSIGKVLKVPALTVAKKQTKQNTTRTSKTKYIVKKGDTLGVIAKRHGSTIARIKEASSLKNNKIKVGDVLLIPGSKDAVKAKKSTTPKSSSAKYTVVTGDTLGKIAGRHGLSIKDIKRANNLKSNDLYVGMKLSIPTTSKVTIKPTKTAKAPVKQPKTSAKSQGRTNAVVRDLSIKEDIIKTAKRYLGVPYKFGGNSLKSGIDCSGYVQKIFSKYNVNLPRTARDIYWNAGIKVSKSQLQTGDLVFFTTYAKYPSHVGIYMGNGQFIHASSGARKVSITSLHKKYYQKRYIGAKRIPVSAVFEKEYSQK